MRMILIAAFLIAVIAAVVAVASLARAETTGEKPARCKYEARA
jgi:energy-converting hydrogenase Eha subunit A